MTLSPVESREGAPLPILRRTIDVLKEEGEGGGEEGQPRMSLEAEGKCKETSLGFKSRSVGMGERR